MMTRPNHHDLVFLKDLIEAGKFVPVIDRCYPLTEAADAHRYVLEGHVRGKVILTIDSLAR
jgi:NADPH:quinone reductase-like Zn-dependent oxidoreductase